MDSLDRLAELLFSKLTIYVSGASGPKRDEPLHCFRPVHQSYPRRHGAPDHPIGATLHRDLQGGSLRVVRDAVDGEREAIVYDRDIISTWRLPTSMAAYEIYFWERSFEWAIGQETVLVAVEAFFDSEGGGAYDDSVLLHTFGDFVRTLGTQPVTVTISSVVSSMMDYYAHITKGLQQFSWKQDIRRVVEEFVYTRECFFFPANRAPVLEVTFSVVRQHENELGVNLNFGWNPPVLNFQSIQNVVSEGERFLFKPTFEYLPQNGELRVTEEYAIQSDNNWLSWDTQRRIFHGRVPQRMAAQVSAERLETYTMPLELTARISKYFPGDMRFERVIRCAVPITVKRRPTTCRSPEEGVATPGLPRPTGPRLLQRPPLMRSPFRQSFLQPRVPPPTPKTRDMSKASGKENGSMSTLEVTKLLERKAEESVPRPICSPTKMNPLSFARLHDALSSSHLPLFGRELADIEVRTLYDVKYGVGSSSLGKENERRTPSKSSTAGEEMKTINLGSTHVGHHGRLMSHSESDKENGDRPPSADSLPTRDITPPASSMFSSPKKSGKMPEREIGSPTRSAKTVKVHDNYVSPTPTHSGITCYACEKNNRTPRLIDKNGEQACLTCQESFINRWADTIHPQHSEPDLQHYWEALIRCAQEQDDTHDDGQEGSASPRLAEESAELMADDWQTQIQKNFKEFEAKQEGGSEKFDITMDDVVDSDEELSLSQSGL